MQWLKPTLAQTLGTYLIVIGLLEAWALLFNSFPFETPFAHRGGILVFVLGRLFATGACEFVVLGDIISFCWPTVFGVLFLLEKRPIKTYILGELILSAPTLLVGIDLARFGGGHFLSKGHGLTMLMMFAFFSAMPVFLAIGILVKRRFTKAINA